MDSAAFCSAVSVRPFNATLSLTTTSFLCRRNRDYLHRVDARHVVIASVSTGDAVVHSIEKKFAHGDISRVIDSFQSALSGKTLEQNEGEPNHQRATSFLSGLPPAEPFLDATHPDYQWCRDLESRYDEIIAEFKQVTSQPEEELVEKGTNVWAPPVVEAANAYGPDWKTLVLQDRKWDETNMKLFPLTSNIVKQCNVPSVEVFFAKQKAGTGIKLHTDDCNFILTMHLGLVVPKNDKSWIRVGGVKQPWRDGKALVFDTSFFHETMNEDEEVDRYVLLIRFWHPKMTAHEIDAMSYLFELIEDPDKHPDIIEAKRYLQYLEYQQLPFEDDGKKKKQKPSARSSPARGFGKK